MRYKRTKVLFLLILCIFFIGMIGIYLSINGADKVKETDTVKLPVTIKYVKLDEWGKNTSYIMIDTYEYNYPFRIPGEFADCLQSNKLKPENKIYLKIKKGDEEQLNKALFIDAVGLYCDDEVFVSIDEYNQCIHESIFPTRIAVIVASLGLFVGAVLMARALAKDLKRE